MRKTLFATLRLDAVSLLVETFADAGAIYMTRRKLTWALTRLALTVATANIKPNCVVTLL
jgi:hypothetical protein